MNTINYVRKAITLLDAAKVEYAIIDNDGTVYEKLSDGIKRNSNTKDLRYEYGERTAYVKPYLVNLAPGSIIEVPFGKYDYNALRNCISGESTKQWGTGAYSIELDKSNKCFNVYRFE